jgi:fatty acid desaturase
MVVLVQLAHAGTMSSAAVATTVSPAGLPDPGEPVPTLAKPTVALFLGGLVVWVLSSWAALGLGWSLWLTIPVNAVVSFTMFTVLHDAVHYSISRRRWVNALLGRLTVPFVVPYASAPLFGFIHIEHHRNTNEELDADPDAWATDGPWWQLPFRWLTIDVWYATFYVKHLRRRSARELTETAAIIVVFIAGITVASLTGTLWAVAVIYLIPARIALGVLAWWFDWLPHHGLEVTQRENRYRATRVRIGMEWLLTPVLLYQNYHLVHHLHPSIPFYRYIKAWKRNEEAYLQRDASIMTAFGRDLTVEEYRVWRDLDSSLARMRAMEVPTGSRWRRWTGRPRTAWRSRSTYRRTWPSSSGSRPASTSPSAPTASTPAARGCGGTTRSARRPSAGPCGSRSSRSRAACSPGTPPNGSRSATSWS